MFLLTMKFALYLWLYFILEAILHIHSHIYTRSYTPCPWLYSENYALYIAQYCILKSMRYKIYFIKLASYIA